jgi:hypothetical protein
VDPHNGKILVTLKDWNGARPEFLVESPLYSIDIVNNIAAGR